MISSAFFTSIREGFEVTETNLNTIIRYSFSNYFSHKISDPRGGTGIQNPFDGIAVIPEGHVYWEAKLLKNKIKSFNFSKIEDHQKENLDNIISIRPDDSICIYPIGIWIPRKLFYIFFLECRLINYLQNKNKKSILQKEFLKLIDKELFLPVLKDEHKKAYFDFSNCTNKIITIEKWENVFYGSTNKEIQNKI